MEQGDPNFWAVAGGGLRAGAGQSARPAATIGPFRETWRRPLIAGHGDVAVWLVPAGAHRQLANHARVLGRSDWSAIARVRDVRARDRQRATRITLRLALSHAVGGSLDPAAWTFETTSYGKPRVAAQHPDVHFCISHIGTLAVIAVSRSAPVGVDIETIGRRIDPEVVSAFCSAAERRGLARLADAERRRAFARLWTLKEAYCKLTGTGLATDFKSLEFEVDPEQQVVGHKAQCRSGETSFESWLTEAPDGLCQVSVAVGRASAARRQGELVCFTVGAGDGRDPTTPALAPGQGCGTRVLLS